MTTNKSIFARAAYFLEDLADIYNYNIIMNNEDVEEIKTRDELLELARRMKELNGEWERKLETGDPMNTAQIVVSMLRDWELPGAVWYLPSKKRYRVTGKSYSPAKDEICIGVYSPEVTPEQLIEDFEAIEE